MTDGLVEYFVIPEYWGELIDIGFYFGRKNKPHNANKHLSEYTKKKQSSTLTGAKWMNNGIERSFVMKDKIEYYIKPSINSLQNFNSSRASSIVACLLLNNSLTR